VRPVLGNTDRYVAPSLASFASPLSSFCINRCNTAYIVTAGRPSLSSPTRILNAARRDRVICFSIVNGIIESVNLCDDSFTPTLQVYTSQSVIEEFDEIEDIALALEDGRITYKATGLGKKIKFGASIFFFKLFN